MKNKVELSVQGTGKKLTVDVQILFNGGYAGKNQELVREHIEELAKVGVPAPTTTPTLYPLSNYLATTSDHIQVQHGETSGEVEYVLFWHEGKAYLTVGCDHTDRNLENYSVPKSKQACPDLLAAEVWEYDEVKAHFDQLLLECYVTKDGKRELYQQAVCGSLMSPEEWKENFAKMGVEKNGNFFFSGTVNTVNKNLIFGDKYEISLFDPIKQRRISHVYTVEVMVAAIE